MNNIKYLAISKNLITPCFLKKLECHFDDFISPPKLQLLLVGGKRNFDQIQTFIDWKLFFSLVMKRKQINNTKPKLLVVKLAGTAPLPCKTNFLGIIKQIPSTKMR